MEYLMTYGWAILIIAIVMVALFSLNLFNPYTFAPKASPGSCQIMRPNGPGSNIFVSAVGPTCTVNEIPQYVASFGGINSLIAVSNIRNIPENNITITGWVYESGFTGSGGNYGWSTNNGGGSMIMLQSYPNTYPDYTASAGLWFWLRNETSTTSVCAKSFNMQLNRWYFVAERTRGNNAALYLNGNVTPACTFSYTKPGTENNVTIGAVCPTCVEPSYTVMDGLIGNIQIYNTSLSQPEITALYQEGIGGAPTNIQNLVGWWPLNGNANDYSGNNNNGVPTNVIFTSSWTSGYSTP